MATLRDRYGKVKEIAGQTAINKASLANKSAKQAAALSNASKMTQAILGAQAANDAVSQGFDEGLSQGANMAAQVESENARVADRAQNQKQFEASQAHQAALQQQQLAAQAAENEKNRKQQEEEAKKNRIWNFASGIAGAAMKGLWG